MVEKLCSRVIVLSPGRIALERRVADFEPDGPDSLEETFVGRPSNRTSYRSLDRSSTRLLVLDVRERPGVVLTRHFFTSLFDFN